MAIKPPCSFTKILGGVSKNELLHPRGLPRDLCLPLVHPEINGGSPPFHLSFRYISKDWEKDVGERTYLVAFLADVGANGHHLVVEDVVFLHLTVDRGQVGTEALAVQDFLVAEEIWLVPSFSNSQQPMQNRRTGTCKVALMANVH